MNVSWFAVGPSALAGCTTACGWLPNPAPKGWKSWDKPMFTIHQLAFWDFTTINSMSSYSPDFLKIFHDL
jgi:hypothetical protein